MVLRILPPLPLPFLARDDDVLNERSPVLDLAKGFEKEPDAAINLATACQRRVELLQNSLAVLAKRCGGLEKAHKESNGPAEALQALGAKHAEMMGEVDRVLAICAGSPIATIGPAVGHDGGQANLHRQATPSKPADIIVTESERDPTEALKAKQILARGAITSGRPVPSQSASDSLATKLVSNGSALRPSSAPSGRARGADRNGKPTRFAKDSSEFREIHAELPNFSDSGDAEHEGKEEQCPVSRISASSGTLRQINTDGAVCQADLSSAAISDVWARYHPSRSGGSKSCWSNGLELVNASPARLAPVSSVRSELKLRDPFAPYYQVVPVFMLSESLSFPGVAPSPPPQLPAAFPRLMSCPSVPPTAAPWRWPPAGLPPPRVIINPRPGLLH